MGSNPTLSAMEGYSSGLRGRFAKSLGWVTGAEVRILSTPPFEKAAASEEIPKPLFVDNMRNISKT